MSDNKNNSVSRGAITLRLGDILHDSDGLITLVKLNFLFILTCLPFIPLLPVFTAGPAIKALLHCTNKLVLTGYLPEAKKTYISAFKSNIASSVRAGAACVVFTCIFTAGLYFYLVMSGGNIFYIPFASVSLFVIIFIWSIGIHVFPALNDTDEKSFKEQFSDAVATAVSILPKTIIAVVLSLVFIAGQVLFLPASLPLMLTLGFSVPALCCAFAHTDPEFV